MNIFTIIFLQNFSKIFSKTHQIAPFLKIFSGEHAPEPPLANAWLCHALHGALRHANTPTFTNKFEPPARNEILDTPLPIILENHYICQSRLIVAHGNHVTKPWVS